MKNIFKTLAVAVLMMSAVAAFAQTPVTRTGPPVQNRTSLKYEVRSSKVYYGRVELRNADARTFTDLGYGYAKDKNNVYMNGNILQYVDPASFRLLSKYSSQNDWNKPGTPVAPNVTPAPVGPGAHGAPGMPGGYAPAGSGAPGGYAPAGPGVPGGHEHAGHQMYARYEVVGSTVYYNGVKVKGARASSFKDLGWGYAVDTFDVYYCGREIDASTTNFKVLAGGYAKNSFDVFYLGKEVKGASPSSFKVLSNGYAKDSFDTYYKGKKIDD